MLKEYIDRNNDNSANRVGPSNEGSHDDTPELEVDQSDNSDDKQHEYPMKLQNSDVLANLNGKLGHLSENVQCELKQLIHEKEGIFPDVPDRTTCSAADHDTDVGKHEPIKQHTYRVNPTEESTSN